MPIDFLLMDSVCCTSGQIHWLPTIKTPGDYENKGCNEQDWALNNEFNKESLAEPAGDPAQAAPRSGENKPCINVTTWTNTHTRKCFGGNLHCLYAVVFGEYQAYMHRFPHSVGVTCCKFHGFGLRRWCCLLASVATFNLMLKHFFLFRLGW